MSYATENDLITRFGAQEITANADRDQDGEIDDTVIAAALADADNEINAVVGRRYLTPVTPVPEILLTIACDLARSRLFTSEVPEIVRDNVKAARALLKQVGDGELQLDAPAPAAASASAGEVLSEMAEKRFTRESMKGL